MFQGFREKGKDSEKYPFGENMHLKFFIISFQTYFHSSFHSHWQATFSCPLWALLSDCSSFPCTCTHISLPPLLFSLFAPGYIYTWLICDMCLLLFSSILSVILIHTRAWSRRYFTWCHRKMHNMPQSALLDFQFKVSSRGIFLFHGIETVWDLNTILPFPWVLYNIMLHFLAVLSYSVVSSSGYLSYSWWEFSVLK